MFDAYILGIKSNYRGSVLEQKLNGYEIAFKRQNGITPEFLGELNVRSVKISDRLSIIPSLTEGEICCAYGHKLIYKQIIENTSDWALIFEDDAVLRIDPREIPLNMIANDCPTIIQLSPDPTVVEFFSEKDSDGHIVDPSLVKKQFPQLETCAYFINKAAAKKILERVPISLITARADWPLESLTGIHFYATRTFCAFQLKNSSNSRIKDRLSSSNRIPVSRRLFRIAARFTGITSFVYLINGAPFKASYIVEVLRPLRSRLFKG